MVANYLFVYFARMTNDIFFSLSTERFTTLFGFCFVFMWLLCFDLLCVFVCMSFVSNIRSIVIKSHDTAEPLISIKSKRNKSCVSGKN